MFLGLFAGGYGVIVGAGGGFIFVPALLIFLDMSPNIAAGTGLIVVLINSLSGIFGYVRQKRVNYKMGITLSIGAIPGTFIGVWLIQFSSSKWFYWIFAAILLILGIFLLLKNMPSKKNSMSEVATASEQLDIDESNKRPEIKTEWLVCIGLLLGIISNYFGIGGGWLLVPILVYIFRVLPHYATATSIFSLCLYSSVGVFLHIYHGNVDWGAALWGGLGVLIGAQLGVYLSNRISGKVIIQMLSILLIAISLQLFFA